MNIVFDMGSRNITGVNRAPMVFELSAEIPAGLNLPKSISKVDGQVQKHNAEGDLLYLDGLVETTEDKKATKFEEREVVNKWIDEQGILHQETVVVKVPVEWEYLAPVMVDKVVTEVVYFSDNPYLFTADEVLAEKYAYMAKQLGCQFCYADEFITSEDIDIAAAGHSADTCVKIMSLHPTGKCQTSKLTLDVPAKTFVVYTEADNNIQVELSRGATTSIFVSPTDNKVVFDSVTSALKVRFSETAGKRGSVHAYAIFYNEGV